ncbi:amino acid ABC transporter substrate-binding protein [Agaribacter flavus]|uniref:Amino acid ABC transporter substrate-binding protein n=1 Tax=Agaribacter flavus TaxID=1902781 RepID=A0ABV7FJT8_9ALTE
MKRLIFCVFLSTFSMATNAAIWVITYPQSLVENDERYVYPLSLLHLALEKTGVRYEIRPSSAPMRQEKSLKRLEENLEVNLVWSMTDMHRENQLRPIRIPITKGLIGWRMFIVHRDEPFLLAEINTIDQLLEYQPVQGIAWPDTKILQANGFNVVTARDYTEARALISGRVANFFPRSVVEIMSELESDEFNALVLKPGLAIEYPTAMYFFVNKQNKTLAKLIETGLQRAIDDGSFDELFYSHFQELLEDLNFENIKYFELSNPLLPMSAPTHKSSLWYRPRK